MSIKGKFNTGGVPLSIFELLTATFAADESDLKADWERIKEQFTNYKLLSRVDNTDVIQAITLLATYKHRLSQANRNVSHEERLCFPFCRHSFLVTANQWHAPICGGPSRCD
jgi:hypothetical protein